MKYSLLRAGACTPEMRVSAPKENARFILQNLENACKKGIEILIFPELSISGYTCGDLFLQTILREKVLDSLFWLLENTKKLDILFVVGLPLAHKNKLYNCAAVICKGEILGFVPKKHIPTYSEFYEGRYFTPGPALTQIFIRGKSYPFGTNLLFSHQDRPDFCLAVEICEDLWVPEPPSVRHCIAGATVIANLSASNETIGKADYRRLLVSSQSGKLVAGYIYADAGFGESSTDIVFSGHNLIGENGRILCESKTFTRGILFQDFDLELLTQERLHLSTYPNCQENSEYQTIYFSLPENITTTVREISPSPFVPALETQRKQRCEEILTIQATGLATRLKHTNTQKVLLGLSGGLDSTLALLVAVRAFAIAGYDNSGIHVVTMPGFGTTGRTYDNACQLARSFQATLHEIPIRESVLLHFADIGHDPENRDVTYENAQARERTQILMDMANQLNGMVVGTGDLSELALGWATYNGDHMSMYGVNASIPKTLVRYLVSYAAETGPKDASAILLDILNTPVSPELLPPANGKISQKTEDLVGPYDLHDFFLFYLMRYGFSPEKIYAYALIAFKETYNEKTIQKWLKVFIRRFFSQQFKRSCLPDGPKVGSVALSPRGDWRMSSDSSAEPWLFFEKEL